VVGGVGGFVFLGGCGGCVCVGFHIFWGVGGLELCACCYRKPLYICFLYPLVEQYGRKVGCGSGEREANNGC